MSWRVSIRDLFVKEIHQSYFVVFLSVGIIVGVVLALVFRINYFASLIWIVLSILLLLFAYLKPKFVFVVIALIAGMVLAFARTSEELKNAKMIEQMVGHNVVVSGRIDGDPTVDEGKIKFKLAELCFDGELKVDGSLFVSMSASSDLERNDLLTLQGKLESGFGVYLGNLSLPVILKWEKPSPGDLMVNLRNWFSQRIMRVLPDKQAKLGISYLLGMKTYLPKDLSENLRIVGLVHIVVASGAHLSIIVGLVKKLLGKISRTLSLILLILFIVLFMSMIGWTPSILRAGIMTILTLIAWYVGRKFQPWRIIILVMAITLMMEPMFVIDVGWLLSFASFIGIIVLGPLIKKFCYGKKKPSLVGEMVMTTVSATMMTLPITMYYYGTMSLISIVANILVLPTLSWAMGLVFMAGVVSGIPVIDGVIGFIATKLLDYHIGVVEMFSKMEMFLVEIPRYQWQVFLIYGVIVMALAIPRFNRHFRWKVVK